MAQSIAHKNTATLRLKIAQVTTTISWRKFQFDV